MDFTALQDFPPVFTPSPRNSIQSAFFPRAEPRLLEQPAETLENRLLRICNKKYANIKLSNRKSRQPPQSSVSGNFSAYRGRHVGNLERKCQPSHLHEAKGINNDGARVAVCEADRDIEQTSQEYSQTDQKNVPPSPDYRQCLRPKNRLKLANTAPRFGDRRRDLAETKKLVSAGKLDFSETLLKLKEEMIALREQDKDILTQFIQLRFAIRRLQSEPGWSHTGSLSSLLDDNDEINRDGDQETKNAQRYRNRTLSLLTPRKTYTPPRSREHRSPEFS